MTLYEIDERLQALEEYSIDLETGEILSEDEFYKLYDEIQMALNDKIESTVCFIKNLQSDSEALDNEMKKLKQRKIYKDKLIERLKNRVDTYIQHLCSDEDGIVDTGKLNKYKLETPKMKLSYRKSEVVNVTNVESLPKDFIKTTIREEPNKTEIKKSIKAGNSVDGAELVTKYNMQIK